MDYIASLGTRFGINSSDEVDDSFDKRAALEDGFGVIAAHESALAQQFVSGLDGKNLFVDILLAAVVSSFLHGAISYKLCLFSACACGRVHYCVQLSRELRCMGWTLMTLVDRQVHGDAPHSR